MKLQGKVAVVTGAASGMGKEIAILYAKEGAKVVVSDINVDAANLTVADIKSNGGVATAIVVRKVLPIFTDKGAGVIINVASLGGLQGSRAGAAYIYCSQTCRCWPD
ncbi:NAD(P)-dependent dehydrogenase (short-subunit alcohol dehydrogenase family) [Paenibacillus sp. RC21]